MPTKEEMAKAGDANTVKDTAVKQDEGRRPLPPLREGAVREEGTADAHTTFASPPVVAPAPSNPVPAGAPASSSTIAAAHAAHAISAASVAAAEAVARVPGPEVQAALDAARQQVMSVAEAAAGEDTVTMVFPHPVTLTGDNYRRISFPAGVNEVPTALADHQYLALNGVRPYKGGVAKDAKDAKGVATHG